MRLDYETKDLSKYAILYVMHIRPNVHQYCPIIMRLIHYRLASLRRHIPGSEMFLSFGAVLTLLKRQYSSDDYFRIIRYRFTLLNRHKDSSGNFSLFRYRFTLLK